jgi:hypothetical protein
LGLSAVACLTLAEPDLSATVITSVKEGKANGTLLVRGTGFGQTDGEVFLGTSELPILSWRPRKVKVIQPGDLEPGTYLLTLHTAAGVCRLGRRGRAARAEGRHRAARAEGRSRTTGTPR